MRFLKIMLVLVFCFVATGAWAVTADDISFMTEEYPPFNMTGADGVATGAAVDLLVAMFERVGSSKSAADIQVLPWARGYREVQNTPNTCLFAMTRTEEREPLFKWVGPIVVNTFDAIALKSKGLKISSEADLADLKTGVIRDDVGDSLAQNAGIKHIERVPSNDQNIRKLNEGRIDIWVYGEKSAMLQIEEMGLDPAEYEAVWRLSESGLYYAFHKDTDDALIASLQKAIDEVKADGTYDEIMTKYGVD